MSDGLPIDDASAALYTVGQVADMLGVQQAFLRRLDSLDVVRPARSDGGQRRYSRADIDRLMLLRDLIDDGHTVAGAQRILELEHRVSELETERDDARQTVRRMRDAADRNP